MGGLDLVRRWLTMATHCQYWILLPILACILPVMSSFKIKLECMADLYRTTSSTGWQGYVIPPKDLHVPGLGNVEFTMALPTSWNPEPCCQRLQIHFAASSLTALYTQPGYFMPALEWTLCTPELRLFKCYGFAGEGTAISDIRSANGSWSITVLQCVRPHQKEISCEIGTYGDADIGAMDSPRYSGISKIQPLHKLITPSLENHYRSPCLVEGDVDTTVSWFGSLATMTIAAGGSISYRFMYHATEPSNDALLTVLFYTEEEMAQLYSAGSCSDITTSLTSYPQSSQTLPLSISNVWAGCAVEDSGGLPTYICEGGRTFPDKQTLHITVSSCHHADAAQLSYFFEFLEYEEGCPSAPDPWASAMTNSMTMGSDSPYLLAFSIVLANTISYIG